ncbi:MAG: trigger factor [Bacteriovoracaceae bacterium]|jgi:trigger factor|nr:trigger factor [Bacteriovoracaceae bacterium]
MSYTVESINGCTKKLLFNFDSVDLSEEINSTLKKKQKEVSLKGFRKGKAPLNIVQKLYGPQVENEALHEFISAQFFDAIKEEDLKAVGYPKFANTKFEDKKVSFEATVETFPSFEIKDYSGYSFTQDNPGFQQSDLDELKGRYLGSKSEMTEVTDKDRALEVGLTAVCNFQGVKEDGERPENMKGEEHLLEIGSNQFIPGFEDGMVGMKAGDKKDIVLTFPEDYHEESLKSAKVTFETELLEIKEKKTPELTDELAKEFGFESVKDFETKNEEQITFQKDRATKEKLHQEILNKFVEDNSFDVPSAMIAQQEQAVQRDFDQNLRQQGFTDQMVKDYFTKWSDDITQKAIFQVRSGLILDKLGNEFSLEVSEQDVDDKVAEISTHAGLTVEQVKEQYSSDPNILKNLKYAIREEKTFELLKGKFKVEIKSA